MKFETILLNGLFVACVAVCALVMGAMLKATPSSVQLASQGKAVVVATVTTTACTASTADTGCVGANG
jgi:hypothetical protein